MALALARLMSDPERGDAHRMRERAVHAGRHVVGKVVGSPLLVVLLLACAGSAALGDIENAAIIALIVTVSSLVELIQTRRSEHAASLLRRRVAQTATVVRRGRARELPIEEIVVGDRILLVAGDLVPADAKLLESKDLHVDEAALTGESLPTPREAGESIYLGTSVVSGTGSAVVERTGAATKLGAIARDLANKRPPTEFERGTARFGLFIMKTVAFLVVLVVVCTSLAKKDPLDSLLFAIALAVGLTPEFLPMITTVTLSRGALAMAKHDVIVKNLAAIQNFGSIDILCSDKTGTLTTGVLTLETCVDPHGQPSERALLLAYVNSYFESGVDNALDAALLRKAKLDPLDSAVLRHDHPDLSGFRKLDEIPFDFERRRVSVMAARGDESLVVTKGAPEQVLDVCTEIEIAGVVRPLDAPARARVLGLARDFGMAGHRVLAVAYRRVREMTTIAKDDERDLVLVGLLGFVDPPREDAHEVLAALARDGITVKVITGDALGVATHICARVGLGDVEALVGDEIDALSDPALAQRAERTHLFARVTPMQKTRIVRALRARGHVVGFMGDGINDAPSLHAADVGISVMGAVDVARDAADIILLEPGLGALREGVREGRRAAANVMKYLLMGTSSAFGNMASMAAAAAFLPFLPMLPKQILLVNLLYDLAQLTIPTDDVDGRMLERPRRWNIDVVRRFAFVIGPVSSLFDFLTFWVLLRVWHAEASFFHTGWFVESLATQTLVIFVIRTMRSPLASRPSRALSVTALAIVVVGVALPYTPLGRLLGLVALPASFLAFVALATAAYLGLVEIVKRRVVKTALEASTLR